MNDNTETARDKLTLTRFRLDNERQTLLRAEQAESLDAREYMAIVSRTEHLVRGHASTVVGTSPAHTRKLRKEAEKGFKSGPADFPYAVRFDEHGTATRGADCVVHGGCVLTVDIDDALTATSFAQLDARLHEAGAQAVFSTSWSHRIDVAQVEWAGRLRVLVDRNVMADELLAARVGLGVRFELTIDEKAAGKHTLYFHAACPPERAALAFHRTWTGEPLAVDELVALGAEHLEQRASVRLAQAAQRLQERGVIELAPADVPASAADQSAAQAALRDLVTSWSKRTDHRKRSGYVEGLRYGATVRVGGLDDGAVRDAIGSGIGSEYLSHFENGYEAGLAGHARELEPIRSYDKLVEREAAQTKTEQRMRAQMFAQEPGVQVTLAEGRELLNRAVGTALRADGLTIVQAPAGLGKSLAVAGGMSALAREDRHSAYASPDHAVAHQTHAELANDISVVHAHSVLIQVGKGPVCRRADELRKPVFEFGQDQHAICRRCPFRVGCEARDAYEQRLTDANRAAVLLGSHAGIDQIASPERATVVDENPGIFETHEVSRKRLEQLANGAETLAGLVDTSERALVATVARGLIDGVTPERVQLKPNTVDLGAVADHLERSRGRVRLSDSADVSDNQAAMLKAATSVLRVAVEGLQPDVANGFKLKLHTPAYDALANGYGSRLMVSATPMLAAFPGANVVCIDVREECAYHQRTAFCRSNSGQTKLVDGLEDGSTFERLRVYIQRLRLAAKGGRIMLATFMAIEKAIAAAPERVGGLDGIVLRHFPLRGANDLQEDEHGNQRVTVFATFGDPRLDSHATYEALGLSGEALDRAVVEYAADQLYQAHERARAIWARWPIRFFHEGSILPMGWHEANARIVTLQELAADALHGLEDAMAWGRTLGDAALACGASLDAVKQWRKRGHVPAEYGPALDALRPELREQLAPREDAPEGTTKQARHRARQKAERASRHRQAHWAARLASVSTLDVDASAAWEGYSQGFAFYVRELLEAA